MNRPVWWCCPRFVEDEMDVLCRIQENEIQSDECLRFIRDDSHGGQNVFMGIVRKNNHGREVTAVAYDAFIPLAEKTLREIIDEAAQKWPGSMRICAIHRIGTLRVGEASVLIGVSTRHRDECYQISRYLIEQLKVRVPIWKKEFYTNGETEWLKGHSLCAHHP